MLNYIKSNNVSTRPIIIAYDEFVISILQDLYKIKQGNNPTTSEKKGNQFVKVTYHNFYRVFGEYEKQRYINPHIPKLDLKQLEEKFLHEILEIREAYDVRFASLEKPIHYKILTKLYNKMIYKNIATAVLCIFGITIISPLFSERSPKRTIL